MNRRSFFSRLFAALVATRLACELTAAPIEANTPAPELTMAEAMRRRLCADCKWVFVEEVWSSGTLVGWAFDCEEHCDACALALSA